MEADEPRQPPRSTRDVPSRSAMRGSSASRAAPARRSGGEWSVDDERECGGRALVDGEPGPAGVLVECTDGNRASRASARRGGGGHSVGELVPHGAGGQFSATRPSGVDYVGEYDAHEGKPSAPAAPSTASGRDPTASRRSVTYAARLSGTELQDHPSKSSITPLALEQAAVPFHDLGVQLEEGREC